MDNTFWAFISLILFLGLLVYFKVPGMITKALDQRAKTIDTELAEARALKDEARRQLAEYQRRRSEAEAEAGAILAGAEREAAAIVADARQKSADYVTRRQAMAELKISQAEQDAIAEVRGQAIDIAVNAAAKIIADRNAMGESGRFTAASIAEVRNRLN